MAAALKAALADYAVKHPDRSGDLPWAWLGDREKLEWFRQRSADAARIRQALDEGATPESLGLVRVDPGQRLRERGQG